MRLSSDVATADQQHGCALTRPTSFADAAIEQSLCARFAEQVAVHRFCLAVREPQRSLTYGELDAWANGIAHALLEETPVRSAPVSLMFAQGGASIAAILGTLKSGAAYASLDPSDPRGREFVERLNSAIVLTDNEHRDIARAAAGKRPVLVVEEISAADPSTIEPSPDDLAYVYFTSGSTGQPKGVCDCHRNVLHNVLRYTNTLSIAPSDRLSLIQSPSFSGTVSSLFGALLNGAAVFPFRLDDHGASRLADWLREERITIYHSVPAIFRALLRADTGGFPDARVVRLEGDRATALDVKLHRRSFRAGSILVNGLGLTETGLVRQYFVTPETPVDDGVLPVGYGVQDMDLRIVGDDAVEVPRGTIGEIAVRSNYLALGYWSDPELTGERFLEAPDAPARMYLTGDLGRLRQDGCVEYLGRRDGELKINGNRVEPAEVEAELVLIPGVSDAAVTTGEGRRGEGHLVAFIIGGDGREPSATNVRAALEQRLPRWMVPSAIFVVDELPLGPTGKIDRRALSSFPAPTSGRRVSDRLERVVAQVWEEVLDVRPIGADDDFFALGGDSLAAMEIITCLERELDAALPLSVFVGSPTVASLTDAVRTSSSSAESSLVTLHPDGERAPIVLVHGNTGNLLHYAPLVHLLRHDRPVLGLEYMAADDLGIDAIAASHIRSLLQADRSGRFVVVGFCYGAVLAHEIACQLRTHGHDVAALVLLGVTPLEFPTLVSASARSRWSARNGAPTTPFQRTIYHLGSARALQARERPRYLARRGVNLCARALRRVTAGTSRVISVDEALRRALATHRPESYPGRALVVLHEDEMRLYTGTIRFGSGHRLLARLTWSSSRGSSHAMLENPGATRLAELSASDWRSSPRQDRGLVQSCV